MQCFLLRQKVQSARVASRNPAFIGIRPTISHTCWPYLRNRWVLLFVHRVAERNEEAGWMRKVSRRIAFVTQGFESFHSHRSRAGWCNLVCVECLYMIKPMFYWWFILLWVTGVGFNYVAIQLCKDTFN